MIWIGIDLIQILILVVVLLIAGVFIWIGRMYSGFIPRWGAP